MKKFLTPQNEKKLRNGLQAIPSMGITFIVLGVIILTTSFMLSPSNNFLLFAGFFLIVAGCLGYIYSLKKG